MPEQSGDQLEGVEQAIARNGVAACSLADTARGPAAMTKAVGPANVTGSI